MAQAWNQPTSKLHAVSVFILTLTLLLQTTHCQRAYLICNGEAEELPVDQDVPSPLPSCYRLGNYPMDRTSANRFCRRLGGTLSGFQRLAGYREMLSANGITSLWSNYVVRNGRLVQETAGSPEGVGLDISSLINTTEPFYAQEGACLFYEQCEFTEEEVPPEFICGGPYSVGFTSCEEQLHFLCETPARVLEGFQPQVRGSAVFINDQVDYSLQFSVGEGTLDEADSVCRRQVGGSETFRFSNSADEAAIWVFTEGIGRSLGVINVPEDKLSSTLFWVDKTNKPGCFALALTEQDNTFRPTVIQSWPCDAKLRVLCQAQRVYTDQTEPEMKADIRSDLIQQIGTDILAHSDVIRQVGGLVTLNTPQNVETDPIDSRALRIFCDVPFLSTRQSVTTYSNGEVLQRTEGREFYEVPDLVVNIGLRLQESFPGAHPIMDSAVSYNCDYNPADSNRLLTSNYLFVRPTDVEIFSTHFHLDREQAFLPWGEALLFSLTNQWPSSNLEVEVGPDGPLPDGPLPDGVPGETSLALAEGPSSGDPSQSTQFFLFNLNVAFASLGYAVKPLELRDLGPGNDAVLVAYAYRQNQDIKGNTFTDIPSTDTVLRELQSNIPQVLEQVRAQGVTKIDVRSIDWCWATTRRDDVTNNDYDLPTSRAPFVWKSSEICARDNAPLVTIECEGDKQRGFVWGPTKVNPLCDYSDANGGESSITEQLQELAQDPMTPEDADTTADTLNNLVESVDGEELTPTDVNLIADVLQKVTTTGGDLDPEAVEDILRTVDAVSRVPEETLREGQSLGKSSNRILEAADRAGGLLNVPSSASMQRVVSGGLGLEVWDLETLSDSNLIVGIKVRSDGAQEMLTYQEMISQYTDTTVTYDQTDAAIYLPEEFLRRYAGSGNGTEVRLVMNMYKITSLYRDSSMGEEDGVNKTLNSQVIAAQLLVNQVQVTDLQGYKVLTVFKPTVVVPTEERPNRTTCVFWDFSANEDSGGWSSEGCQYGRTRDGRDICECDHLTNFAVLVSFYDQSELEHAEVLGYITIVGLSLSIVGLALSMLSFIFIKKLRKGRPQQTLFQLSLALLLSWVVFLVGIERTSNHDGCIAVAAILHYLILASFMWMLMEGLLQYLLFVRVMNSYFTHYMLKTSIPSWGLPIIPVVIVLAIDTDLYKGGEDYCWMKLDAFYYAFAIPVGLIILTNLVVFVLVTVSLCRRKDMGKHSSQQTSQTVVNIRASFICFCVLGLSWIFGFLAIEDARLVFQYLFCITASLQGFIVFLMMTARDKQVRQYWKEHLCCCFKGLGKGESSTTASSNSKTGSKDPMRIPRAHSTNNKQEATSLTHSSALSADSDANGSADPDSNQVINADPASFAA